MIEYAGKEYPDEWADFLGCGQGASGSQVVGDGHQTDQQEGEDMGAQVVVELAREVAIEFGAGKTFDPVGPEVADKTAEAVRSMLGLRKTMPDDVRDAARGALAALPRWNRTGTAAERPDGRGGPVTYGPPMLPGRENLTFPEPLAGMWRWACAAGARPRMEVRRMWAGGPRPVLRARVVRPVDNITWRGRGEFVARMPVNVGDGLQLGELTRWSLLARQEGFPNVASWIAAMASSHVDLTSMRMWKVQATVFSREAASVVAVVEAAGGIMRSQRDWEAAPPRSAKSAEETVRLGRIVAALVG